ncbi:P-loop containing nucleoside triphosphate hydrolase protein [Dichotomopilus funicola]|uniref:P-loop containing nucleoside triphosphate hydrolase protein n=1 Tax=Dichotomopilus funicola TaxID=1934379 RepID=A0AAN6UUI3_9PEZI|nr:P-loop containing nucleoside triphosphate hydrolase protein [Dichotomopilus funicola]
MSSAPWDYIAKLVCIGDSGCGKSSLTIRLCEGRFVPHHDVTIGVEFGSRIVPVGPPYSDITKSASRLDSSPSADGTTPTAAPTTPEAAAAADGATAPTGLPPPPTIPNDKSKTPQPPQKHMKLSLWDTAGQETYKSVTRSYFRGASGALLVFDLTRKSTFQHVTDWLNDLRQIAEPDIVVVLVGNKADLASPDAVAEDDDDNNNNQDSSTTTTPQKTVGGRTGAASASEKTSGNKREVTRAEAEAWARRNGVLEYVETSAKSGANVEKAFMHVAERIFQNIQAGKYDLNDRRSGVKGHSAGGSGGIGGGGRDGRGGVRLTGGGGGKGLGGGCC